MAHIKAEAVALRTAIKANARLEIELKGRISELLRAYHVNLSDALLVSMVFAVDEEVEQTLADPLPTPSLPPVAESRTLAGPLPTPSLPPVAESRTLGGPLPTPSLPPVAEA